MHFDTTDEPQGGRAEGPSRPAGVLDHDPIPVFVLDDHPSVVASVAAVITATPGLIVAGTATSVPEADEELTRLAGLPIAPVLLTDVFLGAGSGIEVTRRYVRQHGGAAVLMSARSLDHLPLDWQTSGASSFLPKDAISSATLLEALGEARADR